MKTLLPFLLFLCPVLSYGQTLHPAGVAGCIAHWTFTPGITGILVDSSNNGHSGISHSITSVGGYRNRAAQAMRFNGSSSFVQVPTDTQLNPAAISIVTLIKFNGFY